MAIKFNLNNIRNLKGLTQKELGLLTNLSQSYISNLSLEVKSPTLMVVDRLAVALKVHPGDLVIITSRYKRLP